MSCYFVMRCRGAVDEIGDRYGLDVEQRDWVRWLADDVVDKVTGELHETSVSDIAELRRCGWSKANRVLDGLETKGVVSTDFHQGHTGRLRLRVHAQLVNRSRANDEPFDASDGSREEPTAQTSTGESETAGGSSLAPREEPTRSHREAIAKRPAQTPNSASKGDGVPRSSSSACTHEAGTAEKFVAMFTSESDVEPGLGERTGGVERGAYSTPTLGALRRQRSRESASVDVESLAPGDRQLLVESAPDEADTGACGEADQPPCPDCVPDDPEDGRWTEYAALVGRDRWVANEPEAASWT